ncbi:MAG TPA: polysaccharide deacetylase family protein [Verrucomicrobiae bacterium]|nr:polysaccharide deacetylase family protein [Verrucomicrobiae bacterium]
MKKPALSFLLLSSAVSFLITVATVPVSRAGSVAAPYEIGTWEGFRSAAISYTFDDNVPNQYSIAVPMFHAAGFKITLFTVVNYWTSFTWAQAQGAASYGDEIASHTMTHPNLTTNTLPQLTNELANSQSNINYRITNELCLTLAYPYCAVPNKTVVARYYLAARGCSGSLVPSTPSDFLNISSFVLGSAGPYTTGDSIISLANSAANSHSWCVYLIHSIDVNDDYSPLSSGALQASVNYLSTNQDKFWVETFGNVVRYIQERNASSVAEAANTGSSITVQVTNNLNPSIYNYPITLRRPVPAGWPAVAVSQNGQPLTAKLVSVNSTNYVMFDVVPNSGDVVLSKTVLPFTLSSPALTAPASVSFQLNGQTGVTYTVYSSTDLTSWRPVQSNTLAGTSADFTVDASSPLQFYRAQWAP